MLREEFSLPEMYRSGGKRVGSSNYQVSSIHYARAGGDLVAAKIRDCRRSVGPEKAGSGDTKGIPEFGSCVTDPVAGCDTALRCLI